MKEYGGPDLPWESYEGIGMRDYFAAKALQGLLAATGYTQSPETNAERAYKTADAMLKVRDA